MHLSSFYIYTQVRNQKACELLATKSPTPEKETSWAISLWFLYSSREEFVMKHWENEEWQREIGIRQESPLLVPSFRRKSSWGESHRQISRIAWHTHPSQLPIFLPAITPNCAFDPILTLCTYSYLEKWSVTPNSFILFSHKFASILKFIYLTTSLHMDLKVQCSLTMNFYFYFLFSWVNAMIFMIECT